MKDIREKVVVLIMAHKSELSEYESVSIRQCLKILTKHKVVFICPRGLDVSKYREICPTALFDFIDPVWQSTYSNYNRLKSHPFLYKRYSSYEFILFYEPDAFVFKDELLHWCNKNYDYLGAPWFSDFANGTELSPFLGVGNGGLSLRKVSSHLKVLHSFSYCAPFRENWNNRFIKRKYGNSLFRDAAGFFLDCTLRNNTFWMFNNQRCEDQFWGLTVARNFDWFKVASPEEAAGFSIEMQPRRVFNLNNRQLPFGCHKWWEYDFEFWKPHIEKFGYNLSGVEFNQTPENTTEVGLAI